MSFFLVIAAAVLGQSVDDAVRSFQLPPGLKIERVASDPLIESPVAMQFGPDGRLWVVEMRDYPNGPGPGEKPGGRIRVLDDTNNDGVFDTATTFADNLLFANGLLLWKDGVIVTAAPNIIHLRDTDGDGVCDRRDILFEGFATQNPQLRVSHPVLGLDGWITVANGLRGGSIVSKTESNAKPIPLAGMDFRFDPLTGQGEAISGMGQFGNTFDDWGNRFVCDNRNHLRHVVMSAHAIRRNPHLALASPLEDISDPEPGPLSSGAKVYPLSKNWTTSNLHAGRFTAACGVFIHDGDAYTCDPTGNLVHREILTPRGASFQARPAYDKKEFLASPDDSFRPVFLANGPGGHLHVVDMRRAIIEHPEWMPPELRNHPNLLVGRDKGRIWRIVDDRSPAKSLRPRLDRASTAELVSLLDHPNSWQRSTAHRLLLERRDPAAIEPLKRLVAAKTTSPRGLVIAVWLLKSFGAITPTIIDDLLQSNDPRVAVQGIALAEATLTSKSLPKSLIDLATTKADPRVRFALAVALGASNDDTATDSLATLARAADNDRWIRSAIAASSATRAGAVLERLARPELGDRKGPPIAPAIMLRELAGIVGARRDPVEIDKTTSLLPLLTDDDRRLALLMGLADGLARRGGSLDAKNSAIARLFAEAASRAEDAKRPLPERLDAIHLLAHAPGQTATLSRLLDRDPAPVIRMKAVQALAAHSDPAIATTLVSGWSGFSPAVRQEVANALLARPERVRALLTAIENKAIAPRELDAVTIRRLSQHPIEGSRARALLAAAQPGDRKKALDRYREALSLKGDPIQGREVFKKSCAACHQIAGIGQITGPDISDTRTKTPAQLLTDILDPNAAIDANFIAYLATTKAGKSLSGLIVAETASSITLRRAEGQVDVVLRDDLDELRSTGRSLMPEGLENDIPVPQMAHLIAFLKNWRYLE